MTINSMLVAVNGFFSFMGWEDCRVRLLRIQRRGFREQSRELTQQDYRQLVTTAANQGKERTALLLETITATGIRVSEVRHITVEAVDRGRAEISSKGKIRTILLPGKLQKKLKKYAKNKKNVSGEIFLTRNGTSLSRKQIWAELKALCDQAGIPKSKVYPHNLRHLFASVYYQSSKDIVQLADLLGHSNVETTRIYLQTSGQEHARQLDRLHLIL